jgi:hypothetical protein
MAPRDPDVDRGLAVANGENPERLFTLRNALSVFIAVVAAFVLFLISGCAEFSEGMKTARDAARIGCAILAGTDGTTKDLLNRTQDLQKEILDASAKIAVERGADAERVAQDMKTIAALAETLRLVSASVVQSSGNNPARLVPCAAPSNATAP